MRNCSSCDHFPQDNHCMGCIYDHEVGGNTKWESKNNPDAIERKVIKDIKAEIDQKQYDFMSDKDYDEGVRFGLMLAYQIINRKGGD